MSPYRFHYDPEHGPGRFSELLLQTICMQMIDAADDQLTGWATQTLVVNHREGEQPAAAWFVYLIDGETDEMYPSVEIVEDLGVLHRAMELDSSGWSAMVVHVRARLTDCDVDSWFFADGDEGPWLVGRDRESLLASGRDPRSATESAPSTLQWLMPASGDEARR